MKRRKRFRLVVWTQAATISQLLYLLAASVAAEPKPSKLVNSTPKLADADLCYLADGSSSVTLIINEATPVGSIVGTLEVNGDPTPGSGNVELQLADAADQSAASVGRQARQRQPVAAPPLKLAAGSRTLQLARELDKESAEAQTSLLVEARCRQLAPAGGHLTVIPIRILVTDANDHAPEFAAGGQSEPVVLNVSEATPVGALLLSRDLLQATDGDAQGPHSSVSYRVLAGAENETNEMWRHFAFTNPLEPNLYLVAALDFESMPRHFSLQVAAQDQDEEAEPLEARLRIEVNILDSDDQNPRFMEPKYRLLMDENQAKAVGQKLRLEPSELEAEDADRGLNAQIVYSIERPAAVRPHPPANEDTPTRTSEINAQVSGASAVVNERNIDEYLHIESASGQVRLLRRWPLAEMGNKWPPITLVVKAAQANNRDRYALATLTVVPNETTGAAAAPEQRRHDEVQPRDFSALIRVPEDTPPGSRIGRVCGGLELEEQVELIGQQQEQQQRSFSMLEDDSSDLFAVTSSGELELRRPLDFEVAREHKLRVLVAATKEAAAAAHICRLRVEVINVNDNKPKFLQTQFTFHLTESRLNRSQTIGQVQAHDADANDTLKYRLAAAELEASSADCRHNFQLDSHTGELSLRQTTELKLSSASCQLQLEAEDSRGHVGRARAVVHVAPQLLGRALRLADQREPQLVAVRQSAPPPPSYQRSALATVVASLQHMMGSANLSHMPASSALLLSALLIFLLCLLFIVVVSMSLHVYRRRSKHHPHANHHSSHQPQQQNQRAVHFRHAQPLHAPAAAAAAPLRAIAGLAARARVSPAVTPALPPLKSLEFSSSSTGDFAPSLFSSSKLCSYRSATSASSNSSVINCGHYTVNGTLPLKKTPPTSEDALPGAEDAPTSTDDTSSGSQGALMALVRDQTEGPRVMWPTGAVAQRVKRLTWNVLNDHDQQDDDDDDEISDCQVAPDVPLTSNNNNNNKSPISGTFLSSISPELLDIRRRHEYLFPLNNEPESHGGGENFIDYTIVETSQRHPNIDLNRRNAHSPFAAAVGLTTAVI